GQLAGEPQDSSQATYAKKLNRSESAVDWTHSATQIERRIRAFDPWPGSTLRAEGATLKILRAAAVAHVEPACPGRVLSAGPDGLLVKAGRDAVRIERVQRPGGRAVDVREYLNGHPVPPGTVLESSGH
ncbi:MAG: methionyl-tRNA formyltransferase, partial [Gammaproteobacteria bacterium]|nr:methionyl-tRNA formyltransferase [Gammaproteobacteria bacterium]